MSFASQTVHLSSPSVDPYGPVLKWTFSLDVFLHFLPHCRWHRSAYALVGEQQTARVVPGGAFRTCYPEKVGIVCDCLRGIVLAVCGARFSRVDS
jgi:hypothetical protein